ncbi:MAG: hypothetical protein WBB45_04870 [Cyclobacteriaceae bacterium]
MGAKPASYADPQEERAALSSNGASPGKGPVQRLIGFEVEAQESVYGPALSAVTLNKGKNDAVKNTNHSLYGGLPYDTASGGSDKKGEASFKLTTDYRVILSTEPIRAKLAVLGKLNPADTKAANPHSNLEYVTSPMNELAAGADKTIGDVASKMASHASSTYGKASANTGSKLDSPSGPQGISTYQEVVAGKITEIKDPFFTMHILKKTKSTREGAFLIIFI